MSRTTAAPTAAQTGKSAQPAKAQAIAAVPANMQEKIAMRAYQKWLKRGCQHGNDQKDWLDAEAEVKAEMTKTGR